MVRERLLGPVERYYTGKFKEHGPVPAGVDWNSADSQDRRFEQLLKVCDQAGNRFSLIDYGCGYGALVSYLARRGHDVTYRGYDISKPLLEAARVAHAGVPWVEFTWDRADLEESDYTVASGIFNVKLDTAIEEWLPHVLATLDAIAGLSRRGFAFNALTSYSDPERMRSDLYYADPVFFFDHCKRQYARNVALLHDYGLYEFTVIVRFG